jgi:hypothetical protein
MDIVQFMTDATAIMQKIGGLATTTLAVGSAVGQVLDKGNKLLTVLIAPRKPAAQAASPAPAADVEPVSRQGPIVTRPDVAILVDINRRMLVDARQYLAEKKLDADLIVVTNDPEYGDKVKFLNPAKPDEWEEIAREFNLAVGKIRRAVGRARLHIFLSTPLPLAFALGALMGTVNEGDVLYHWEKGTYWPVITISRGLRQ